MAAPSKQIILSLYKNMLRESSKFTSYNYRCYAIQRIKDAFREHKDESDPDKVAEYIAKANDNLGIIKRQVIISQLYSSPHIVIEDSGKSPPSPATT
ncbi:unnamed protein product [Owenia fusiformis]|uniref:Complex 1 LYR protein domain-containing protein n=1 Tax=Owenia fusiformis TaxID=6347 RepID=A0A8S4NBC9_OWEFU|nr:unnamed protein product [Owenia fusiformis]